MANTEQERGLVHRFVAYGPLEDIGALESDLLSENPSPVVKAFLAGATYRRQRVDGDNIGAVTRHAQSDVSRIESIVAAYPRLTFDALVELERGENRRTLSASFMHGRIGRVWMESSREAPLVPPVASGRGGR